MFPVDGHDIPITVLPTGPVRSTNLLWTNGGYPGGLCLGTANQLQNKPAGSPSKPPETPPQALKMINESSICLYIYTTNRIDCTIRHSQFLCSTGVYILEVKSDVSYGIFECQWALYSVPNAGGVRVQMLNSLGFDLADGTLSSEFKILLHVWQSSSY